MAKFTYRKSDRKNKKLFTIVDGKQIHFGDSRYEQYFDKTGIWTHKNHNDKERRRLYLARAKANPNWNDPRSAAYHAIRVLW